MTLTFHLQAVITLLALVNPVMCSAIFGKIAAGQSQRAQLRLATQAAATVLVILLLAALFGAKVLSIFGVSLDAFSVAGGGVLAWIGISMLDTKPTPAAAKHADPAGDTSLTPLIMFAASPGTITGVITLAVTHSQMAIPISALLAVAVAVLVMWTVLLLSIFLGRKSTGSSFVHDTVTRFMGLIVIAMGVQFALTGIHGFFNGTIAT